MARYTGPKHKLARREGVNILDKDSQSLKRRLNIAPGIWKRKRQRQASEYKQQLREKQKAKAMYGLLEKQFKNLVKTVEKKRGETGEMLLGLLETRLDNIVYRLGFAKSRFQARQFVSHRHILVNGKKISIPSYRVKEGDVISLSDAMQQNVMVLKLDEEKPNILPFVVRKDTSGKLLRVPTAKDLEVPFNVQMIIEYYSR